MVTLGALPAPTPAGVPVMMRVPLGRVVSCERKLTIFAMEKIRSLYQKFSQDEMKGPKGGGRYPGLSLCLLCTAVLHLFVVEDAAHAQLVGVWDEVLGYEHWADGARTIEAF
jgi:hypothetical protein